MTNGELIKELMKYPKDKTVEIGTISTPCGVAMRVIEHEETIEIESNED